MVRSLVFLLAMLPAMLYGQVTVTTHTAITGLVEVQQHGDLLIVGSQSQPKLGSIGIVRVKSEAANVIVKATDATRRSLPMTRLDANTYAINASGRVWVRVVCIDFAKNIYTDDETEYVIGPAPPTPPTPPGPDNPNPPTPPGPDNPNPPTPPGPVPPDSFDNIGQRVAGWTAGLSANVAVGNVYLASAKTLRSDPNSTIAEQADKLKTQLSAIPGYNQYGTFITEVNKDLQARWATVPMSKGTLADYWTAVAAGLGVK